MLLSPFRFLLQFSDRLRHRRRKRLWHPDLAAGRRGEDLAHRFLQRRGYTIVARNYRARSGMAELDIVAREGETVAVVEVKTRSGGEHGPPERAIGSDKRRKLFRGAREYIRRSGAEWSQVRFDVVTVILTRPPAIEHYRDVFPLAE
jgi:putative endonuclease